MQIGCRTPGNVGRRCQIDTDPDDDRIAGPFQQDTTDFGPIGRQDVIGPFDLDGTFRRDLMQRIAHGQSRDESERWRLWIGLLQTHNGACKKIAARAFPTASQATTAAVLRIGAKPESFRRANSRALQQVGVGRPC